MIFDICPCLFFSTSYIRGYAIEFKPVRWLTYNQGHTPFEATAVSLYMLTYGNVI